jgi:hypothetical protein
MKAILPHNKITIYIEQYADSPWNNRTGMSRGYALNIFGRCFVGMSPACDSDYAY